MMYLASHTDGDGEASNRPPLTSRWVHPFYPPNIFFIFQFFEQNGFDKKEIEL